MFYDTRNVFSGSQNFWSLPAWASSLQILSSARGPSSGTSWSPACGGREEAGREVGIKERSPWDVMYEASEETFLPQYATIWVELLKVKNERKEGRESPRPIVPYCDSFRRTSPWGSLGGSSCTRRPPCRRGRSLWRRCHCRCRRWRRVDPGGRSWSHLERRLGVRGHLAGKSLHSVYLLAASLGGCPSC